MREDAVRRVNSTLQASFGKRYSVKLFGSTVYGTDHADSDLDMAFLVGHLSFFSSTTNFICRTGLRETSRT